MSRSPLSLTDAEYDAIMAAAGANATAIYRRNSLLHQGVKDPETLPPLDRRNGGPVERIVWTQGKPNERRSGLRRSGLSEPSWSVRRAGKQARPEAWPPMPAGGAKA
jgi:hypothetical protein